MLLTSQMMKAIQSALAKIGYAGIFHASIFFAVFNHFPNWGWTKLPKKYLENEYLTADSAILTDPSDAGSSPPTSTLSNSPTQGDLDGGETMGYTDELLQRAVSTISCTTLLLHVHMQGIK